MKRALWMVMGLAVLAGCGSESGTDSRAMPEEEREAVTNRVDIPESVRRNLGITFARVERRVVEGTLRVPGAFELEPRARREYRLTLPGTVELVVDQYERVEAGDVLFRYRSPEWPELQHEIIEGEQGRQAALASIDVARARIDEAERVLTLTRERIASLAEAGVRDAALSAQAAELEASLPRLRAELRLAETGLANAELTLAHALHRAEAVTGLSEESLAEYAQSAHGVGAIDWLEVRAGEAGVVETVALTDGAYAEATALVVSVVNPERVRFRATALQADLERLTGAMSARIVSAAGAERAEAEVSLGLEAHPENRTIALVAMPGEWSAWMRPGVSAFLEVVLESSGGVVLAVPVEAVVQDGLERVLFRRDPADANKAIRMEADVGASDGRWVEVRSGLMLGDEVVIGGVYELKLATSRSGQSQKGGHFHADGTFHEGED